MNSVLFPLEKESIILVSDIPDELKKYKLAGAVSMMAKGSFGHMLFHHFKGDGYKGDEKRIIAFGAHIRKLYKT